MKKGFFNHIVITRFNIQYELNDVLYKQPAWIEQRLFLFQSYCLPSIERQTCKDFVWLLLCSDQTPEKYKQQLLFFQQRVPQLKVLFCPFYDDNVINLLYNKIGEEYVRGYSMLVSTRVDNDDMLEAHYVEYVQNYVNAHDLHNVILTFDSGVQWFLKKNMVYTVSYELNHFTTFVEDKDQIVTCLGINHVLVPKDKLIHLQAQNMWCEIVHETNMLNDYTSAYQYSLKTPEGDYPVPLPKSNNYKKIFYLLCKVVQFNFHRVCRFVKKIHGN